MKSDGETLAQTKAVYLGKDLQTRCQLTARREIRRRQPNSGVLELGVALVTEILKSIMLEIHSDNSIAIYRLRKSMSLTPMTISCILGRMSIGETMNNQSVYFSQSVVNMTGGLMVMGDSFNTSLFKQSFQKVFNKDAK